MIICYQYGSPSFHLMLQKISFLKKHVLVKQGIELNGLEYRTEKPLAQLRNHRQTLTNR
jgi:hypothetical protein